MLGQIKSYKQILTVVILQPMGFLIEPARLVELVGRD